MAAAVSETSTY